VSPTKPSNGCCETGPTQQACSRPNAVNAGPSNWPNSTTHDRKAAEHGVVEDAKATDYVAEKCAADTKNVGTAVATALQTQHPCTLDGGVDSMGDTVVAGGGPVTSSSMETWTTYDGASTPPRVQSSPYSLVTPALDSTVSSPQSTTSWLHRISPTALTTNAGPLDANSANNATDSTNTAFTPPSSASDVTGSQKVTTSTAQTTANEPLTQEDSQTPPSSSDRSSKHKRVTSSTNDDSASCEVVANKSTSSKSDNSGKETSQRRVSSKTDLPKSPETSDENKSNLMVGLVKVKSRHTGLMIDCPILETVYQNETRSSPTVVRQSSSHKVVLIKAVVPRWAWNGRGQFSPQSSSRTSLLSAKNANKDIKANKRKSSVSVNTQTSDTLLLSVRRTISEHQTPTLSPTALVDTLKYVPALQDDSRLVPSPKLSRCMSTEKTATPWLPPVESRVPASLNTASQNHNRILPEELNLPTAPLFFGSVQEKSKESGCKKRSPTLMEYNALMADTIETLKLDLQFSSSGNNSDSDSVTHEHTAVKSSTAERINRCSSSSSEDTGRDRRPSSSCQGMPTLNWSCAATAATASSDAIDNYKTSSYVDEMAMRTMQSSHQKPTNTVGSERSPTSQGRSLASDKDSYRKSRAKSKCPFSPKSSQTNETKARLMPDANSRPNRSPCPWRPVTHNDVVLGSWHERDFTCHDPHYYEHKQRRQTTSSQQRISSTTQYASRSESSLSNRSKSRPHDCYHVSPTKLSPTMSSTSSKSQHTEQNSIVHPGYLVTSDGSDACATVPIVDVDAHHHYRETSDYRFTTAGDVESGSHRSRHNHHRSPSAVKHRTAEQKLSIQERYKTSTSAAKRSGEKQRKWSSEATRRADVAQSSRSTGSMAVSRNARSPTPTHKRQHSSSASRHVTASTRTEKRDISADRRLMSSRGQRCSAGDSQRRNRMHHSASQRPDRQSTPSGRRQRYGSRMINASLSRSADSLSRRRARPPSVHANYSTTVGVQSKSTQPLRVYNRQSRRHDDRQLKATFYECRQPIVYCSPRSLKPFPPPISDRYPASSFDNSPTAAVETPSDAESAKYMFVQGQDESDFADGLQSVSKDCQPLNELLHRQERLRHPRGHVQTSTDDQRRRHTTAFLPGNGARRHRKKLPATPTVDSQGWCTEPGVSARIAVPSVVERPAWKQY